MVNFTQTSNFFLSQISPFQISTSITANHFNLDRLKSTKSCAVSHGICSNKKDKSFLISLFYLVLSSLVVSTICVSSSTHTVSFIANFCPLAQAGLITTDQLNQNNLSTFNILLSCQFGFNPLYLCPLAFPMFFKVKSCSLSIPLLVGSNHFPISSLIFSGPVSSAFPIRYTQFGQNRSIFPCRVLSSRITPCIPVDSSKINSFSPVDLYPTCSDLRTQAFQVSSFLIA